MYFLLALILWFPYSEPPPGTKKVGDIYVDKTEILNIHWLEYLHYKKVELDSTAYQRLLPDSSNTWYHLAEHRFKPIVLISYQQAVDFCQWRSKMVNARLSTKVTYRLPSPEEWKTLAQIEANLSKSTIEKKLSKLKKKTQKANALIYLEVNKPENKFYNLFDNVSEMTQQEGIAMGSNNFSLTDLEQNLTPIRYTKPNPYLGFRCVAEIED